ncbi:MAG: M15 family metallopeptidase [Parcubacteria group bacterium]
MKLLKITFLSGFFLVVLVFGALIPFMPVAAQQPFTACDQINPNFQPGTCQGAGDFCGNQQGCYCNVAPNEDLCCYDPGAFPPSDRCYVKSTGQRKDSVTSAPADVSSVAIEPLKADVSFIPQITLPGSKFIAGQEITVSGNTLGEWISAVYVFFVGACAIVATVMMMYGGYKYVISFGSAQKMSDAQDQIVSAMIGLALSIGAYMILLTVSPNLVKFKTLSIPPVPAVLQGLVETGTDASQNYGQGQDCLLQAYGDSVEAVSANLVSTSFAGHTVSVHKFAADAFKAVSQTIGTIPYPIYRADTFNWRKISGSEKMSLHSFGIAIDINPKDNPFCPAWAGQVTNPDQAEICRNGGLISDIPLEIIKAFKDNGFEWGGNWTSVKDPMHFEWRGGPCLGITTIIIP